MDRREQSYSYREIDVSLWEQIKPLLEELHTDHHERWPEKYAETTQFDVKRYTYTFGIGCFIGDRLVGLCWGDIKSSGRATPIAWIEDFIVSKEYRSFGIGGRMLELFRETAKQHGAYGLELCTESGNYSALRFYEREKLVPTCLVLRQLFE